MKKIDYRKLCHPAHPEFRLSISPFYLMAHADFEENKFAQARELTDKAIAIYPG